MSRYLLKPVIFLALLFGVSACAIFGGNAYQKKAEGLTEEYCQCLKRAGVESLSDFESMGEETAKSLVQCIDKMSKRYTEMKKGMSQEELDKLEAEMEKAIEKAPCKNVIEEMMSY